MNIHRNFVQALAHLANTPVAAGSLAAPYLAVLATAILAEPIPSVDRVADFRTALETYCVAARDHDGWYGALSTVPFRDLLRETEGVFALVLRTNTADRGDAQTLSGALTDYEGVRRANV